MNDSGNVLCETVINGVRRRYDACSSGSLKAAKSFYLHAFRYIGSSNVMILNRIECHPKETYHFFVYKKTK